MSGAAIDVADLDAWLEPFLDALGRKTRRTWAPLYLRGLLGPGERKSLQPMAARLGLSGHDQLHHFISSPAWDDAPLWTALAREADRLVGGPGAVLVIDDTALPKKGALSAGVARQYCGQLGKKASCQALVSLTLARDEVPIPVALRLFLPAEWTRDPDRCARAGVPEAAMAPRSKGEIALVELDRLLAAGVRFGAVLADAGYGASAEFRRGLDERKLRWAVGIPRNQKVYGAGVRLVPPAGRKRKPVPGEEPRAAEEVLAGLPWRRIAWRRGTKGALAARFAAVRVRVGDGAVWGNNRHLPGEEAWLVGERRASGETKYYLSNLPAATPLEELAATIKARWVCEQAHQQLKEELGLDHFEGRSWSGWHHHVTLVSVVHAFVTLQRLDQKRLRRPDPVPDNPRAAIPARVLGRRLPRLPAQTPTVVPTAPSYTSTNLTEHY